MCGNDEGLGYFTSNFNKISKYYLYYFCKVSLSVKIFFFLLLKNQGNKFSILFFFLYKKIIIIDRSKIKIIVIMSNSFKSFDFFRKTIYDIGET